MIPKRFEDITKADIDALVANAVAEGRTIEYKRELPGNSDEDKREFLADVSSFANGAGGDIIYGVEEDKGVPTAASGLPSIDPEKNDSAAGRDHPQRYPASRSGRPDHGGRRVPRRPGHGLAGPEELVIAPHGHFQELVPFLLADQRWQGPVGRDGDPVCVRFFRSDSRADETLPGRTPGEDRSQ